MLENFVLVFKTVLNVSREKLIGHPFSLVGIVMARRAGEKRRNRSEELKSKHFCFFLRYRNRPKFCDFLKLSELYCIALVLDLGQQRPHGSDADLFKSHLRELAFYHHDPSDPGLFWHSSYKQRLAQCEDACLVVTIK